MLGISREEFREIYKGTSVTEYEDVFYSKPQSDKDYIENYLNSKLWRLNNLYTIVVDAGDGTSKLVIMNMNKSQHKVYAASLRHARIIILKSRQQGISTLWLVSFFDDCCFNSHISSGLMAQGDTEAQGLLLKVKILWEAFPRPIKDYFRIEREKNNSRQFSLKNGSSMYIQVSFRSGTLQRLHISEFAKIANNNPLRARETKTGTLQAIYPGNTAIVESTAEGDNDYKIMWDKAVAFAGNLSGKDFVPVFLSWLEDPRCSIEEYQEADATLIEYFLEKEEELGITITQGQKNFYIAQYRELGQYIVQEYPTTADEAFLKNREGTYYADLYLRLIRNRKREVEDLFDPNLPVQVAMDLGRNELHVLIFFQTYTDGWRIINSYTNFDKGVEHYCTIMDKMQKSLGYDITNLVLPHDARVKSMNDNMKMEYAFHKFGYKNTKVLNRTQNIHADREILRQEMEDMYIDRKVQYIIDCFLNYTKKYDEANQVYKDTHQPNRYAHGADALRYMVIGGKSYVTQNEWRRRRIRNTHYQGMDL